MLSKAQIFGLFSPGDVPEYKARGFRIISLVKKAVNEKLLAACHEEKIKVYVWTLDREKEMKRFLALGVDGIYSNRPAVLKRLIGV